MTSLGKRKRFCSKEEALGRISRRRVLACSGGAAGALVLNLERKTAMVGPSSPVAVLETGDRREGVKACLRALNVNPVKGKDVLVKPNFNTADPAPGSTHNDTLTGLIEELWAMGARSIRLGERSYPMTQDVMEEKGVLPILEKLAVQVIDFDLLAQKDWVFVRPKESHWSKGFRIARPILETECLVSTGCLKTHQFGGIFTLSLKLHVGVVPTSRHGFDYMRELHSSPHQRRLIAEINGPFTPSLVVLDGVDAFVDGGPATGKRVKGNLFLAGTDRVAVDAAAVAMLKHLGSNERIMTLPIFKQEQIERAAELGLGASSPAEIDLLAADERSGPLRDRLAAVLALG
jgi:uncharacterized protein (DUF362 family)